MSFVPAHCLHPLYDYPCVSLSSCVDGYLCLYVCACVSDSLCGAANLLRGNLAYSMQHLLFPPPVQGGILSRNIDDESASVHVHASALTCARTLSIFIVNIKFLERFVARLMRQSMLFARAVSVKPALSSCCALFTCCQNTCFCNACLMCEYILLDKYLCTRALIKVLCK